MRKNFLRNCAVWIVAALSTGLFTSCDNDDNIQEEELTTLPAPEIVQSEEIMDNPLSLSFSWIAVDHATMYNYQLKKADDQQLVAQGSTDELSMQFVYSKEIDLLYDTQYIFTLQACVEDKLSEQVSATVTTSAPAIRLSMDSLTYRSMVMIAEPQDPTMLYQFAQIPMEKYTAYDSDMEFIEGYDFGYYKAMAASLGGTWYQRMEYGSEQGSYRYATRMLSPETDYLLYAYGVEFDHNSTEDPVQITTPMIKLPFTTPAWEATSDCTFEVEIVGQDLVDTGAGIWVSPTVKVTPTDKTERYYVAIFEESMLSGYKDIYDLAFNCVYSDEQQMQLEGQAIDWTTSPLLASGDQILTGYQLKYVVTPGDPCFVMVFGLDGRGLVTTKITRVDFTAITSTDATHVEKKAAIKRHITPLSQQ